MLLSDDTATLEINTLSLHDALPISLQQGTDGRDVGAFESDLGEAVLRDLHGSAGLPHLLAQLLHLGDRETGIVSDNDDVRGLEDPVQRLNGRFLFRSIHVGTLFGWL